jgi:hypothetical protein
LRAAEQAFRKRNANIAVVGLGDRDHARVFREETGITFPLLIDEKRQAYRAARLRSANLLHILRRDNAVSRARAAAAGHRQWNLGRHPFQLGGSFAFGPGNVDYFIHVAETFGDNVNPAALLAAIP